MPIPNKVYVFSKDKKEDYGWRPKQANNKNLDNLKSKIRYDELTAGPFSGCDLINVRKFAVLLDKEDLFFLISDIPSKFVDSFRRPISVTGIFHFKKSRENILWVLNTIKTLIFESLKEKEDSNEKPEDPLKDISGYLYDCFKENKDNHFAELPVEKEPSDFNSANNDFEKTKFFKLININSGEILKFLFSKKLYDLNELFFFSGSNIDNEFIENIKIPVVGIGKELIKTEGKIVDYKGKGKFLSRIINTGKNAISFGINSLDKLFKKFKN